MLTFIPFLLGPLAYGVIALIIFSGSIVVFSIPVLATRGRAQILWFLAMGALITAEAAVLITLGILVDQGTIWN
ncbi:MAG: hypothetical protein HUU14_11245 [Dehalococcoidia bacterium]|nr:hypothetical protein [Dehalococcoidia bacterium]NUQ56452.1 hypothetical protein [Dehalococcoidia bacterium]RIL01762.1 MAG: hypothetical protein DCC78_10040 [bacterium]